MSETHEQFRERMGFVNYMGALAHVDAGEARADWNDESQFTQDAHKDAAEAGYAQALREVMGLMREREIAAGDFAVTVPAVTDDDLLTFAAERGIDLDGGQ